MTFSTSAVAVCCCAISKIGSAVALLDKPCVFDGDDGLIGKGFNQPDLLVGKWLDLQAISEDDTEQVIALENRNSKDSPNWSDVF